MSKFFFLRYALIYQPILPVVTAAGMQLLCDGARIDLRCKKLEDLRQIVRCGINDVRIKAVLITHMGHNVSSLSVGTSRRQIRTVDSRLPQPAPGCYSTD
jgi:hypothetical protein